MQTKKPFYATPEDAEAAFYDALERADLEAMMAVWDEGDRVVCVHPNGARVKGFVAVRQSWQRIFSGGPRLKVRLSHKSVLHGPQLAMHSVHENISVSGEATLPPPVIATNLFVRGDLGWRIVLHHASPAPVPPVVMPEGSKTLH